MAASSPLELVVFLVYENILGRSKFFHHFLIFQSGFDDRLKFLVVLVELDEFLHVGHYLGISELLLKLSVSFLKAENLLQK